MIGTVMLEWIIEREAGSFCVDMQEETKLEGSTRQNSARFSSGYHILCLDILSRYHALLSIPNHLHYGRLMGEIGSPTVISNRGKAKAKQFGWTKMMVLYHGGNGQLECLEKFYPPRIDHAARKKELVSSNTIVFSPELESARECHSNFISSPHLCTRGPSPEIVRCCLSLQKGLFV
jgi:hypothetical protein